MKQLVLSLSFSQQFSPKFSIGLCFSFENEPHRRAISKFVTLSSISLALKLSRL